MTSLRLAPPRMPAFYRRPEADGLALFAAAPSITVAGVDDAGLPVVRVLNGVVVDGKLCFHGGDHGEKLELVDRPAVATTYEIVASIPSYFVDPTLACPATTYYLSAVLHGVARRVDDPVAKAAVLEALMRRFQPEGGYAPIRPEDPRYATMLRKILVVEIAPERITTKHKLGQKRSGAEIARVLEGLFARGAPGDLRAIRLVRDAHPERPTPGFLAGPEGVELCVAPDEADAVAVAELLADTYWGPWVDPDVRRRAQLGSDAWVVARDAATGAVIGSARAVSDGTRFAYVLDVVVAPSHRRRGVGDALMRLLLAHPRLRDGRVVRLRTRDAQGFYARFGFGVAGNGEPELERMRHTGTGTVR